jgi:HEAT repeat protein
MRSRDALKAEGAFHLLLPRAADHIEDLMGAFEHEQSHGVRCWLLELIGEARSERAFDLLRIYAASEDDAFRSWAIRGLQKLGTPAARSALFERGLPRRTND